MFAQLYYGLPGVVRGANGFDPRAGEIVSHHVFKHLPMAVAVNDNDFPHLFRCVVDEQIEPKTGFARMHAMDVDNHLAALPGYLKQTENLPSGMNSEKGAESNCSLPHCKLWLLLFILARPCGLFLRLAFTLRCVAVILRFRVGVLPGCPELFRLRGPGCGEFITLCAQHFRALRRNEISGFCTRLLDHPAQAVRVLQHRTGAQMVIIERLTAPVGLEQGAAQRLNQRVCADVGIRKMDEYAGLDIARGIDT